MVPRSHSRAMVSEVSRPAMIIMMTATRPGTIMLRLASSSLYQMRVSALTGRVTRRVWSITWAEYCWAMACV
jgi:hypothetical protein